MKHLLKPWATLAASLFFPVLLEAQHPLGGTLTLEGGRVERFKEVVSLIFTLGDGAESVPQNVVEWPVAYNTKTPSRSVPLSWVRSIEITQFETKAGYRCLFNPVVSIETVSGVVIVSKLKTLEWIRVKTNQNEDRTSYFASAGEILIRKIVFDSK